MAKYYVIGDMKFSTKKDIQQYYSNMLNKKYSLNEKLNLEDSKQLYHLLRYHPNFEEKRGVGIKFFRVETAVQQDIRYAKHRCFYIHRHDGSKMSFSIHSCYKLKDQIEKVEA